MGMYESPITIIESTLDSFSKAIIKQREDAIFAEVQSSFGVDLDKDELIRALQYDRNQYDKGYADGFRQAIKTFVDRLHQEILDARNSNFKAINERKAKYESDYDSDPFLHYCQGKIQALDGIDYFVFENFANLKNESPSYGERRE